MVGESGCGKSVSALSIMGLLPRPPAKMEGGQILFAGENLLEKSESEMEAIRGNRISMIFQEPMTALNPVYTVGDQVSESFIQHQGLSEEEAWQKSIEMLQAVGIPSPDRRVNEYPHQLSGGMRQRVMIAMALACKPELLIADEPTTALDVTIQAQILDLMNQLKKDMGMAILFITHDLGVVAEMCDDVVVMYAGVVVEKGPVLQIFKRPQHPYTKGLMQSKVHLNQDPTKKLETIEGVVPSLTNMPVGCPFADRCDRATDECYQQMPPLQPSAFDKGEKSDHAVACFHPLGGKA